MSEPKLNVRNFKTKPTREEIDLLVEVLKLVKDEKTHQDIARQLGITGKTPQSINQKVVALIRMARNLVSIDGTLKIDYRGDRNEKTTVLESTNTTRTARQAHLDNLRKNGGGLEYDKVRASLLRESARRRAKKLKTTK